MEGENNAIRRDDHFYNRVCTLESLAAHSFNEAFTSALQLPEWLGSSFSSEVISL